MQIVVVVVVVVLLLVVMLSAFTFASLCMLLREHKQPNPGH